MNILIIDPDIDHVNATVDYFSHEKYNVIPASTGEDGLNAFHAENPDIVILETKLPDINGYQCVKAIRDICGEDHWVPIIFLSEDGSDDSIANGLEAGSDAYLVKPVSAMRLLAKINAMRRIIVMRQQIHEATDQLKAENESLNRLSLTDSLTEIANRRSFDKDFKREWYRTMRNKMPLSLVLIDVDCFKKYNDHYGHLPGDNCLKEVAEALSLVIQRAADSLARYGGEEFACLLPNTEIDGALRVAEKMRAKIEALHIPHSESTVAAHVTVSIGVANTIPDSDHDRVDLIHAADKALYTSKLEGRNRVTANPLGPD